MAWIGWATDLKTVSEKLIRQRMHRTGSNKIITPENKKQTQVWGWNDPEMTENERKYAVILNKNN